MPSTMLVFWSAWTLWWHPTEPIGRFKSYTGVDLPHSACDLRAYFSGGGFADLTDIYAFRCKAAETERLIELLALIEETNPARKGRIVSMRVPLWPAAEEAEGFTVFEASNDAKNRYYYLLTDQAKEQVYVFVGGY
jgi:hypothetical protein